MSMPAALIGSFILFSGVSWLLAWVFARRFRGSKAGLLVANRGLGSWEAALSVAASWIWAPSLFVSGQKAYQEGVIGLFWFVAPNVLCLILFAFFAGKVRREFPQGFTLSQYIREKTSDRVQALYWISLSGLAICAFAVQLLAGGQFLSRLTGFPFLEMTLLLAATPLTYSLVFGLKATVVTDFAKMILIYGVGAFLIPWAVARGGGLSAISAGAGGVIGTTDFWSDESLRIFLTFGVPTTIGLLSGPFGDQTFWQRLFATRQDAVRPAFLGAAALFAIVPLSLSLLGFLAAGISLPIERAQMVNTETIGALLPPWASVAFATLVLAGLISILDSKLAAVGSLGGHDWARKWSKTPDTTSFRDVVRGSRWSMLALTAGAIAIANIPGLTILHLFLFYGTLRSATFLPTILVISGARVSESGMFWGIIASASIGLPVFAYGSVTGAPTMIVAGSLWTVLASGLLAMTGRNRGSISSDLSTDGLRDPGK